MYRMTQESTISAFEGVGTKLNITSLEEEEKGGMVVELEERGRIETGRRIGGDVRLRSLVGRSPSILHPRTKSFYAWVRARRRCEVRSHGLRED